MALREHEKAGRSCVVLLAHGSRSPGWAASLEAVLAGLRAELGDESVHLAYMQMMGPGLAEVVSELAGRSRRVIRVLPMLISGGHHGGIALEREAEALRHAHPGVSIEILPILGEDPRFAGMVREIVREAL